MMTAPAGRWLGWRRRDVRPLWAAVVSADSPRECWRRLAGYLLTERDYGLCVVTRSNERAEDFAEAAKRYEAGRILDEARS